MTAVTANHKV